MSGKVIAIISGKGGVGKTTVTANLGAALALRGARVILVDADIGLRNLDLVMGLESRIVHDLVQVVEGFCAPEEAVIRDRHIDRLHLLPAAQTREHSAVTQDEMRGLCLLLAEDFDYTLIDSPSGIGRGFRNAVAPASQVIVVTNPSATAIRDADRVIGITEAIGLPPPGLILNRARRGARRRETAAETRELLDLLSIPLLGTVPEDDDIIFHDGKNVSVADDPRSASGEAFRRIAACVNGDAIPAPELNGGTGVATYVRKLVSFAGVLAWPR